MPIFPSAGGGGSSGNRRLVVFDASSGAPVILKSVGVNSITDNGAGDFTLNFDAMPDANYAATYGGRGDLTQAWFGCEQHDVPVRTTTQLRVYTLLDTGFLIPTDFPMNSFVICDQ